MQGTHKTTMILSKDDANAVRDLAFEMKISQGALIRQAIKDYINKFKKEGEEEK